MRWYSEKQNGTRSGRRGKSPLLPIVAPLMGLSLAACDLGSLLEVDLPGQVTEDALQDPALAETLVLSAQGDFECGLVDYIWYPGLWFDDFLNVSASRPHALMGLRNQQVAVYADPCASGTGPVWTPIQTPRHQATRAIDLINSYQGTVPNKDFLIAKARLYEGYSIQLLGEQFCQVTMDGGPAMSREKAWAEAEKRFTEVINLASKVTTGPKAKEAAEILNAAYVGRARARLNMGNNPSGVVEDASKVPLNFRFVATYDASPFRRTNKIHRRSNVGEEIMPDRSYLNLTVAADGRLTVNDGVPDPRVVLVELAKKEPRGVLRFRQQGKYLSDDADIPFATGREAQLMIAEARGGQTAVNIINTLRATHGLPRFSSSDPAEITATLREERRRELWMQGTRAGDMLRWGTAFRQQDDFGQPLAPAGCLAIPFLEQTSNTNL